MFSFVAKKALGNAGDKIKGAAGDNLDHAGGVNWSLGNEATHALKADIHVRQELTGAHWSSSSVVQLRQERIQLPSLHDSG
jgi:hypothetical protein